MPDSIVGDFPPEDSNLENGSLELTMLEAPSVIVDASTRGDLDLLTSAFNDWARHGHKGEGCTALNAAVDHNHAHIVAYLLDRGIKSTIHHLAKAAEQKCYPVLQALLDDGLDINQPVKQDEPPPLARTFDDIRLTRFFLENGADPNARCYFDITPFSWAVISPPLEVIELLMQYGASLTRGYPMSSAIRRKKDDCSKVVRFLLEKGAPVNDILFAHDKHSFYHWLDFDFGLGTPLHDAAEDGDLGLVNLLLEYGADATVKNTCGKLPIQLARENQHEAVVKRLDDISKSRP